MRLGSCGVGMERNEIGLQWSGARLEEKRRQAINALKASFSDPMFNHKEWVQMTELLWQLMTEKLHDAQLDVLRCEKFSTNELILTNAADRVEKFSRHQRMLRALNFLFKCHQVDWKVFLQTVVELVESKRTDVKGINCPSERDQSSGSRTTTGKKIDNSRASQS